MQASTPKEVVVVFKSDGMGSSAAAQELREVLARKFLGLLDDSDTLPAAICFYTDGVKLVCEASPVLAELRALEAKGLAAPCDLQDLSGLP